VTTLTALRDAHAREIAENPIEITIHRTEYVDDGAGGRDPQSIQLPTFTGRMVPARSQPRISVNEAGMMQTADWLLLAPWDVELKKDDTFEWKGRSFRIVQPIQRRLGGEVYAVQAQIEEVD
jgi:hypothetical protein